MALFKSVTMLTCIQNKQLDAVRNCSRASTGSTQSSRAVSVSSNGTPAKGKGKKGKK